MVWLLFFQTPEHFFPSHMPVSTFFFVGVKKKTLFFFSDRHLCLVKDYWLPPHCVWKNLIARRLLAFLIIVLNPLKRYRVVSPHCNVCSCCLLRVAPFNLFSSPSPLKRFSCGSLLVVCEESSNFCCLLRVALPFIFLAFVS